MKVRNPLPAVVVGFLLFVLPAFVSAQDYPDAYVRGVAAGKSQNWEVAIREYTLAIQLYPNHWESYYNRGLAYFQTKRYEECISDNSNVLRINPRFGRAFLNRGLCNYYLYRYDTAIADYNAAALLISADFRVYLNRGSAYDMIMKYTEALADFDRGIQLEPNSVILRVNRGRVLQKQGKCTAALVDLDMALQLDPNDADGRYTRGFCHAELGDLEKALADFQKYATSSGITPERRAEGHNAVANIQFRMGLFDDAVVSASRALEIDPSNANSLANRGAAYMETGKLELALGDLNKVIAMDATISTARYYRGRTLFGLSRYADAIGDLDFVLKVRPNHMESYYYRGMCLYGLKEFDKAESDFSGCIALSPKADNCFFDRALARQKLLRYDEALADLKTKIQLDPRSLHVYSSIAWNRNYANDGNAAYEAAAAYLDLNGLKNNGPYVVLSGYIGLRKAGKLFGAKAFLEAWLPKLDANEWSTELIRFFHGDLTDNALLALAENNDELTEAHAYIGMAHLFSGKTATAKTHFEWVRTKGNKDFVEYDLAVAELNRLASLPARKPAPASTRTTRRKT